MPIDAIAKKINEVEISLVYILVTECNMGFRDKIEMGLENNKKVISRRLKAGTSPPTPILHPPSILVILGSRMSAKSAIPETVSNQSRISLQSV